MEAALPSTLQEKQYSDEQIFEECYSNRDYLQYLNKQYLSRLSLPQLVNRGVYDCFSYYMKNADVASQQQMVCESILAHYEQNKARDKNFTLNSDIYERLTLGQLEKLREVFKKFPDVIN